MKHLNVLLQKELMQRREIFKRFLMEVQNLEIPLLSIGRIMKDVQEEIRALHMG